MLTRCPLCSTPADKGQSVDGYLVCPGCSELLSPSELVRRATRRTRRAYRLIYTENEAHA